MPRKLGKIPSYCRHKASGQAVVRIGHRDHYLGPYGSPESHTLYQRLVAEWRAKRQEVGAQLAFGYLGLRVDEERLLVFRTGHDPPLSLKEECLLRLLAHGGRSGGDHRPCLPRG